ncbi:MAG: hypothetical protein sL5_04530 [Candidatus Mesenet longicola]|uniref:Ankyrin repeat domain-containing protein n=1 Tax=Candidatus Mesenet longicola TaxID=1892558 RepID=A0A8J3HUS6_9RICK|nr:MAG: hypothetical protein sGL2_04640 [Candidatus Mesenet longicola]GHM59460.1 MAG: hypothetical protein sL5_04530 [Candidatus Mesenet longicola]
MLQNFIARVKLITSSFLKRIKVFFGVSAKNNKNTQPSNKLISTVQAGDIAEVESLLNKGEDPNSKNYDVPIIVDAILKGDKEMVKLLLNYSINKGRSGDPYYIEESKIPKRSNQIEYLDVQVNSKDRLRFRCQHQYHNRSNSINNMLDYSSTSCILNDNKLQNTLNLYKTYSSSHNPDFKSIEAILEAGVYINAQCSLDNKDSFSTPLALAVERGDKKMVELLLKYNADEIKSDFDRKLLYSSLEKEYKDIVQLFLQHGIDINNKIDGYSTRLHRAASHPNWCYETEKYVDEVAFLLKHGADVNIKNGYDATPLSHSIKTTYTYSQEIRDAHLHIIELLLEAHKDIDVKDDNDQTPLHRAAEVYQQYIIKFLLERGANPNAKDRDGRTPLSLFLCNLESVEHRFYDTFFTLLVYGTILSAEDIARVNRWSDNRSCLAVFKGIKAMPHLGKLIEVNQSRNKEAIAKIISEYANDEAKREELVAEFQTIKENYGTSKEFSFIPECCLNFVENLCLPKHKEQDAFKTGALAWFLTKMAKVNHVINMEIKSYGLRDQDA